MPETEQGVFKHFPADFQWLLRPQGSGYTAARAIYNMRDSEATPALIARAADEQDVLAVARFATETGTPLAVRAGGHGSDGTAMPDGALVVDVTALTAIDVDKATGVVRLGAGVLLGDMDIALEQYGLVVPAYTVSTTGVAGLTLGGGVGYNMRRYGATVDSLLACDVVTLDGRMGTGERDGEPGSVLGAAGRWRQLRRGDRLRVPGPPHAARSGRPASSRSNWSTHPRCLPRCASTCRRRHGNSPSSPL